MEGKNRSLMFEEIYYNSFATAPWYSSLECSMKILNYGTTWHRFRSWDITSQIYAWRCTEICNTLSGWGFVKKSLFFNFGIREERANPPLDWHRWNAGVLELATIKFDLVRKIEQEKYITTLYTRPFFYNQMVTVHHHST